MKQVYFFIFFLAINSSLLYGQTDSVKVYQTKKLLKDFDYLFKQQEDIHPNCYAYISKEDFEAKKQAARIRINHPMTRVEFYKIIIPVFCSTNEGHTQSLIYQFDEVQNYRDTANLFPLKIKYYNNNYYVVASAVSAIHRGDILLSINDITCDTIFKEMLKYINGETKAFRIKYAEIMFKELLWFLYGFDNNYNVTIKTPDNHFNTFTIKGKDVYELQKVFSNDTTFASYSYNTLDTLSKTSYFKLNSFVDKSEIDSFAKAMFQQIQRDSIENLIIDLRGNNGGDGNTASFLLDYICKDSLYDMLSNEIGLKICKFNKKFLRSQVPFYMRLLPISLFGRKENNILYIKNIKRPPSSNSIRYNGNVYVLIDEGSFSASICFAFLIKKNKRGVIIGKETGGYTTVYIPSYYCTLPYTKIGAEIPNMVTKLNPDTTTLHGVIPDVYVYDNPLTENDEVIDLTLELINKNKIKK